MITKAQLKRKLSREIWQDVFDDDDPFMELYLRNVYQDNETLLFTDYVREKALAHVGFPSFSFSWTGMRLDAGYISGAATLPAYRRCGYMTTLLRAAHYQMYLRQKALAFLIPASSELYGYYSHVAGYYPVAMARTLSFTPVDRQGQRQTCSPESYILDLRKRESLSYITIRHSYKHWQTAIRCAEMYDGFALSPDESMTLVADPHPCDKQKVISFYPPDLACPVLSNSQLSEPYLHGMVRVINARKLLSIWSRLHPDISRTFILIDKDLPVNTALYRLKDGIVSQQRLDKKALQRLNLNKMDIDILTPISLVEGIFPDFPFYFDLLLDPVPCED